jgi:multidrug efflux pump subunit AcrA (membrane-fusion protein)
MRFSAITGGFTASAVAAATIGFVLLGASGHGTPSGGAASQTAAIPVPVASVIKRTVPVYLDYVGTTQAIRSVALQAQVTGYLAEQAAPDGADVKQGDLLYQIDPRDYQAALNQVKAQSQRDSAAYDYSRVWLGSKRYVRPDDEQLSPVARDTRGGCGGDTDGRTQAGLHRDPGAVRRSPQQEPGTRGCADQRDRHTVQYARAA